MYISSMSSALENNCGKARYCLMMFWAVIRVIVATVSYLVIPCARHSSISCWASPSPKVSRPVVFGGVWLHSSGTPLTITIILHFAFGEEPHRSVDEHIAWSTVPVNHGIDATFRIGRNDAEIRDAADVLTDSKLCRMVKQQPIDEGYQRCTLTADRLLSHPEICDCRDACDARYDCSFT
ncbi:UPF0075 family protein, partial [Aureobasidium melanogenum]